MAVPADRNVAQKNNRKETRVKESICRGTKNVEYEFYDYAGNN
jgi:hypothetical protein